jgi:hypothetical protein
MVVFISGFRPLSLFLHWVATKHTLTPPRDYYWIYLIISEKNYRASTELFMIYEFTIR